MPTDTTTSDTERCDLTELLRRECAHCLGHDQASWLSQLRAALLALPGWVAATYPGRCVDCGEVYAPGAAIHRRRGASLSGETGRWTAECCADEAVDPS